MAIYVPFKVSSNIAVVAFVYLTQLVAAWNIKYLTDV